MQILDLSQVMYSVILADGIRKEELEIDLVRHIMLNVIRKLNTKFRRDFGPLVIAADSRGFSWRKREFPLYKAPRKASQNTEEWKVIHSVTEQFRSELKDYFPYKFIEVSGAEADDIVAVLCKNHPDEKKIIISSDKDFIQLHDHLTFQYNPVKDKYVKHENPPEYLIEHVLKGDSIDGVPNIYSDDDTFIDPTKRQTPMTVKRLEEAKGLYHSVLSGDQEAPPNLLRNLKLIDLSNIPVSLKDEITSKYREQPHRDRTKLMSYFAAHELKKLFTQIGDF